MIPDMTKQGVAIQSPEFSEALTRLLAREADGLLLGLLRNELIGVYIIQDDLFRYVNYRFCEMFGYTQEALCGKMGPIDLTAPEHRSLVAREIGLRLSEASPSSRYSFEGLKRDGGRLSVEVLGHRTEFGGRPAIIGIMLDNSERHRAERKVAEQLHFTSQLIDAIPNPVFYKDEKGRYLGCNRAFEKYIGCTRESLLGKSVYDLSPRELADRYHAADQALFDVPGVQTYEARVQTAEGERRDVVFYKATFDKTDASLGGLVGVILDITDRKRMEEELGRREQEYRAFVENTHDVIVRFDQDCRRVYVNPAVCAMTGVEAAFLLGKRPSEFPGGANFLEFESRIRRVFETGKGEEFEFNWKGADGKGLCSHVRLTPECAPSGNVVTVLCVGHDITLLNDQRSEIHQMAFYDSLTMLPNRRLMTDRLQQALDASAKSGKHGALLFIDLDNFKMLNDTLGHDIGDLLLQEVAKQLVSCARQGDTVARIGGDEFVMVLQNLSEHSVEAASIVKGMGEKVIASLGNPFHLGGHHVCSTPSIGIALFRGHGQKIEELFKRADIAMYQAKKSGRNSLRFFDPGMQESVNARAALEGELRNALEEGQFRLHYQVQVDEAGRPVGAEALIRWLHPQSGIIHPASFIALAEESGLVLPIGQWVLEEACRRVGFWRESRLVVSVNVSATQFRQNDFVEQVKSAVSRHGIPPSLLKLELTESLFLDSMKDAVAKMEALKEFGVLLSLDDFGTGYSSLGYLKRLPLDQIKIDRFFVRDIATDRQDRSIVRAIIAMAESLGLKVIAEGVETEEQMRLLTEMACRHFQGDLFGSPLTAQEFERSFMSS